MEKITVLSTVTFTEAQLDKLRGVSPRLEVEQISRPVEKAPAAIRERVEILYGWGKGVVRAHELPRLKWLQAHSAGIDYLVDGPLWSSPVLITTLSGVHAVPMAEHVLAMMLAFRWRLREMWRLQARVEWPADRWQVFARPELRGSTLGIVGYGAIGRELARQAQALGLRVLAANRSGQRTPDRGFRQPGIGDPDAAIPAQLFATGDLGAMLPECDYVVALAPLTSETRHMFNAETFARMKPGAFFFNVGRGALVDEAALAEALRREHLGGAGLDVFEQEPLPAGSPLWRLENIIISPHVAGFTPRYDDLASDLFAANLGRYLAGEPLLNLVDRARGY